MENNRVAKTAGFLMLVSISSRLVGYIRDIIIYSRFGQNRITDAYNAAFSIPDFLYVLLVGGALSSAFIPVFSSYIANDRQEEAWEVASMVFNLVMILLGAGIGLGLIFTPQLVAMIVPGFEPEYMKLTVLMTRIMFLQVLFMSMAGISQGILHSFKHFRTPALGSILYNVAIILVGALLSRYMGIVGFSIGVVAGALLNFAVQVPVLIRKRVRYHRMLNLNHPGVRRILSLIVPILVGQSIIYLNLFVTQNLASGLDGGMIASLRLAERLMKLPISVIGLSLAVALFPTLSEYAARKQMKQYHASFRVTMNNVIFLSLPASVGLAVMATPLIRFMYQQGAFDQAATAATAQALIFYSIGITAYSTVHVLSRAYYALSDTRTPVVVSSFSMLVNLTFSLLLIGPMGHGGLALAYSVTGIFNALVMTLWLHRKVGAMGGQSMVTTGLKTSAASAAMGLVVWALTRGLDMVLPVGEKSAQGVVVISGLVAGVLVFLALSRIMGMEEERTARNMLVSRLRRRTGVRDR